ncbi:uncharacterized protein CCOS01_06096 [Colletotrichum costaricense]|uniref:Uncharacterized protein n=1 Tax=Colletotrichum costaricense TaxID=1209916 RepID=A0AAI9Z1R9_9PEZI|nr:uncharacterized protein CCOS01_06096 [Colletotrichum costaricense]KAK1530993.1 hypothetical protein CCOS01_06096 [Colletotrichum costaricense]
MQNICWRNPTWRSLSLHLLSCSVGLVIGARLLFGLEKSASCVKSTDGHDSSGGGVEALRLFSAHFRPDDMVRTRTEAYRIKQTESAKVCGAGSLRQPSERG